MKSMPVGRTGKSMREVTMELSAATVGSGTLAVFATPAMVALMEMAAQDSVAPFLEDGEATVGTMVNIKHLKATPVGGKVTATSQLIEINGRELVFQVNCYDQAGLIGTGEHRRFVIEKTPFLAKAASRKGDTE